MQEFNLRVGATRIGRSSSCSITIDDPAISREHAEIVVEEDGARIRDLGSRNGVRVNGVRIERDTALMNDDKIRIGQQDLVFASEAGADVKPLARTSRMRSCPKCEIPFAAGASARCPVCATDCDDALDETIETIETDRPTPVQREDRTHWWMALHAELVDKATTTGRFAEAEQALQRVDEAFASAILSGERYENPSIEPLLGAAVRLAIAQRSSRWLGWTLETLRAFRSAPSGVLLAMLESAPSNLMHEARVALASYVAEMRPSVPSLDGLAAIAAGISSQERLHETKSLDAVSRAS